MRLGIKQFLPRGLFGRAALILIVPIVTVQVIVSIAFIQRHFDGVTEQMTLSVLNELALIKAEVERAADPASALVAAGPLAEAFQMTLAFPAPEEVGADAKVWSDLTGSTVISSLRNTVADVLQVDLVTTPRRVDLTVSSAHGPMLVSIPRNRLSASNPHQLLVIMALASALMTFIAYVFLRNQLRPIARLAEAAEAFGRGETVRFRPRGALEVRAAGAAFLDMRGRIERSIKTRTLMLSGISHDLRTPLTRLKLGLSMLPEDDEVKALLSDVSEMEEMVDEFLAFTRGDVLEEPVMTDPGELVARIMDNASRSGRQLELVAPYDLEPLRLRPQAVVRAVENLLGNAFRYGNRVRLTVESEERSLKFSVEDNGPGIAEDEQAVALAPFGRLDSSRNRNRGGGVGLGLSIVADIARSHGGKLILGKSETLGGLRAEFSLSR